MKTIIFALLTAAATLTTGCIVYDDPYGYDGPRVGYAGPVVEVDPVIGFYGHSHYHRGYYGRDYGYRGYRGGYRGGYHGHGR